MDHDDARRLLGLDADADLGAIRAAHRRRIRLAHPDAGGSAAAAAALNEALDVLSRPAPRPSAAAAAAAAAPTTATTPSGPERPPDVDRYFVVDDPSADLLRRLTEAGHEIGEVVFVDPHMGMLEIVIGTPPSVGQLAVTVGDPTADGTSVAFTLEPLGVTPAPPIGPVVDALMAEVAASDPD